MEYSETSPQQTSHSICSGAPASFVKHLHGRLGELSGVGAGAVLTMGFQLVLESQLEDEPVAWITIEESNFFPPDVAESGVDLDALPVIRVSDTRSAARAADKLVRCGAFGLVVLDLAGPTASRRSQSLPIPLQSRLLGLASKHDTALLFLTAKDQHAPSLGPLISLRAQATRLRTAEDSFTCKIEVIKDKRSGPGWSHQELRHGPPGLR